MRQAWNAKNHGTQSEIKTAITFVALLGSALTMSACSPSSPSPPPVNRSQSSASDTSSRSSTSLVLQLQDLPAGYTLAASDAPSPKAVAIQPATCQAVVNPSGGLLREATRREEARFAGGSDGPFVDEQVGFFTTAADAAQTVQRFRTAASGCPSWTEDGAAFSTREMSFPQLTTETVATQATGPGVSAVLVVLAQGKWMITVTVAGTSTPPITDVETIIRAALGRLPSS